MADRKQDRAAEVQTATREAIANQITAGAELARMQIELGAEFGPWCSQACGLSLAHAELLIRWAAAHPRWAHPADVDLSNPAVDGLLDTAATLAARQQEGQP